MIIKETSQEKFYKISWSGYQAIVLAADPAEATVAALREGLETFGSELDLSFSLQVDKIAPGPQKTEFYSTSSILIDLGHKKLARDLEMVAEFLAAQKDKAADPAKGERGPAELGLGV